MEIVSKRIVRLLFQFIHLNLPTFENKTTSLTLMLLRPQEQPAPHINTVSKGKSNATN